MKILVVTAIVGLFLPVSVFAAPFVFNLNSSSSTPAAPSNASLHIIQADNLKNAIVADTFGSGQQGAWMCRTARGTGASPLALLANDLMCTMQAYGYDGTSFSTSPGGSVAIRAAENWTPTSHPTWFKVEVTPRGSTANIMPMFVTAEGHWGSTGPRPTLSNCGINPSIRGTDTNARIVVGSGANSGKCTVTFAHQWKWTSGQNIEPMCVANNQTSPQLLRATNITSTSMDLTGVLAPGDIINFDCKQDTN
jgi:hypothetical protein